MQHLPGRSSRAGGDKMRTFVLLALFVQSKCLGLRSDVVVAVAVEYLIVSKCLLLKLEKGTRSTVK